MEPHLFRYVVIMLTAAALLAAKNLWHIATDRLVTLVLRVFRKGRHWLRNNPVSSLRARPRLKSSTTMILATGGIVAIGGYFAINDFANSRTQRELDRVGGEVSSILAKSIDRHIALAESTAARISKPDAIVNRWSFFQFVRAQAPKNPGLSAMEWVPRVLQEERVKFEKKAQADGLLDFHFLELTPDGRRARATRRSEYYPVFFVEPYPGNEDQLGLDLASNKKFAGFLAEARDTGRIKAGSMDIQPRSEADVAGISVVVPAYRSGIAPASVSERRKNLLGFVRAKFRFDRFLRESRSRFGSLPPIDIYILLYADGKEPLIFHSFTSQTRKRGGPSAGVKDIYRGVYTERQHRVAGLRWGIVITPVHNGNQSLSNFVAWGFVAFTFLLTALLLRHIATMRLGREQAEAASRAKSDFLAMMGHELRTPLNAVIGFSDVMLKEFFGPLGSVQYKTYSDHINRSARHLLELINCILDHASIEAGQFKLHKERFRIRRIADAVFPILQESFSNSGVTVEENISRSPIVLDGDPRAFRQILQNLVSNAVKYTPKGGKVSVVSEIDPKGQFTLCVTDNGIGIREEHMDAVLKPFRQVDNSLSRKYEGAGLGLPITLKLVELHGGKLEIRSKFGEGTTVSAMFPKEIVVSDADVVKVPTDPSIGSAAGSPAADTKKKALPKRKKPQKEQRVAAQNKTASSRR